MAKINIYIYKGPIYKFKQIVAQDWEAETRAVSLEKAVSNLNSQAKKYLGYVQGSAIRIDKNKVEEIKAEDYASDFKKKTKDIPNYYDDPDYNIPDECDLNIDDSNPTEDGMIICDHDWKDIVRIYLQWEGIVGYDNDIIRYLEDEDHDGLEQYLEDEGIYGYESTLISIKEDGDAYCRGMEKEDYINICNDNGIEPQLEFEEVEIISEEELTSLVLNLIKQGKSNLEIKTELEKLDPENFDWYEADDFIDEVREEQELDRLRYLIRKEKVSPLDKGERYELMELMNKHGDIIELENQYNED